MQSFFFLSLCAALVATISAQSDQGVPGPWGDNDPLITIINSSKDRHVYDVAKDSGAPAAAFATCSACITVPPMSTVQFHPGVSWNGAVTGNQGSGTRHEINFKADPVNVWYDSDMEMGMSDSTLGPSNGMKQNDGRPSVAGEQDVLAKANSGWATIKNDAGTQQALISSGYLSGTVGGSLTSIKMDKQAPLAVVAFFQLTAQFDAYIGHGSAGNLPPDLTTAQADKMTNNAATRKMTITGYQ